MDEQFWHERWANNQIGFHQQEINSYLQEFWPQLSLPTGSTVFVPLCGKSRDLLWLREQDYRVLGVEFSPIAVRDFFEENRLQPVITGEPGSQRWACDGLEILCTDLFALRPAEVAACHAVYDRASLIAMPPAMRPAYAEKLRTLFPSALPTLLVSLEYPQQEMSGPPFSVDEKEVEALYAETFRIRTVLDRDILEQQPRFRDKGVSEMHERVYLLTPG